MLQHLSLDHRSQLHVKLFGFISAFHSLTGGNLSKTPYQINV